MTPVGITSRSLLPTWLRRVLQVGLTLALFMAANTVYLVVARAMDAAASSDPAGGVVLPTILQVMVLGHTGAGMVLVLLITAFAGLHLARTWRYRTTASVVSGGMALVAALALLGTGLFILTAAASEANRWAWWLHIAAAVALPSAYVLHRRFGSHRISGRDGRSFALGASGLALLLIGIHLAEARSDAGDGATASGRSFTASSGTEMPSGFAPVALPAPTSPFFPSSVRTRPGGHVPVEALIPGGPGHEQTHSEAWTALGDTVAAEVREEGFASGPGIGADRCARCHADITAQWRASAHRFSSLNNPFYEASLDGLRGADAGSNRWLERHAEAYAGTVDEPGWMKSRWCAACHDPALLLTGALEAPLRRESVEAQAGLTCLACHAIERVHDVTGNGNYTLDTTTDPYIFADAAPGSVGAFLHDASVRARPDAHRALRSRPVFATSLVCATCHKVSLPEAVNDYRWLRGQNGYDSWHDSGISRNAARTFYLPESARSCQDCHMPREPAPLGDLAARDGTVLSHRFLGANTALPYLRGDTASVRRTEAFLREGSVRVDLFAVNQPAAGGSGDSLVMDVRPGTVVRPGARLGIDVVVRNQGVGHSFPGGTNDSNQAWLEFTVEDAEGRTVWRSGGLGADGRVDPLAHRYGAVFVDEDGAAVLQRNAQDIRGAAAIHVIGPGTADVAHYELRLPDDLPLGPLTVRARLLWRKFHRDFTEFAWSTNREGFPGFDEVPDLPITEIARDELRLTLGAGPADATGRAEGERDPTPRWVRFNDYGIALLLEGNTRLAVRAFRRVDELAPDRTDGPLNLARTALASGDLARAYDHLEVAERRAPGDARTAWVWGRVLQEDGRYPEAEAAYLRVLEVFPEDRGAWRNLGRTRFLAGRHEEALDALDEVLAIDPEDRIAHYFRMLALRAAGRPEEARAAEAAFEYYGIDESAQEWTLELRAADAGVNLMAQPIHVHRPGFDR